jgi:hypothetical protein
MHTLASKKSPETHKKLSVQILGRTLPTFHRLHTTHPSLYLDSNCAFCPCPDESSEHLFFQCPQFRRNRDQLLADLLQSCQQHSVHATSQELRSAVLDHILCPDTAYERHRSAAQLPSSFRDWLLPRCCSPARALKVGKQLHSIILDTYRNIWHERCDLIKQQGLLFADRIRMLPRHIPLHEATEDDLRFFADAWQRRHSTLPVWTGRRLRSQSQAIPQHLNPPPPNTGRKRPHSILDFAVPCRPRKRHTPRIRNPLPAPTSPPSRLTLPSNLADGATPVRIVAPLLLAMPDFPQSLSPPVGGRGTSHQRRPPALSDAPPAGSINLNKRARRATESRSDSKSDNNSLREDGSTTERRSGRRFKREGHQSLSHLRVYASLQSPSDELHRPEYSQQKKRGETAKGRE